MTGTDLIDRLKAAIDEDERAARYAMTIGGTGNWVEQSSGVLCLEGVEDLDGLIPVGDLRFTRHIERHDPARVLRQVAAHRKILDIHERFPNYYTPTETACGTCDQDRHETSYSDAQGCPTVLALAEAYGIEP